MSHIKHRYEYRSRGQMMMQLALNKNTKLTSSVDHSSSSKHKQKSNDGANVTRLNHLPQTLVDISDKENTQFFISTNKQSPGHEPIEGVTETDAQVDKENVPFVLGGVRKTDVPQVDNNSQHARSNQNTPAIQLFASMYTTQCNTITETADKHTNDTIHPDEMSTHVEDVSVEITTEEGHICSRTSGLRHSLNHSTSPDHMSDDSFEDGSLYNPDSDELSSSGASDVEDVYLFSLDRIISSTFLVSHIF